MKFSKVDSLPEKKPRCDYKSVMPQLQTFLDMGVKYAKVSYYPNEYANHYSLAATIHNLAGRYRFPITSKILNGEVYVIRTDMED